ncbi:MAG: 50S ribosomal protein L10 [Candidatus Micrarchaeota archaeon]
MVLSKAGKRQVVEQLKKQLKDSKVVAIASVQNLPTKHYNQIRKKIRGSAETFLTRETLVRRAIEEARPDLKELESYLQGSCAIVFSKVSAFKLAKLLRESKSKTFAKPGQIAPSDIVIPAGQTNLPPGPVLTELKQAKIEAKIQGPKVVIMKDATVAKKGEAISESAAKILAKLAIEPMDIGLKMRAAFEDGLIYKEDVLDIDDKFWMDQLVLAHQQALNVAVFAEIFNSYSTPLLIEKAARQANAINALIEGKEGKATEGEKEPAKAAEEAAPAVETGKEGSQKADGEGNAGNKEEGKTPPATEAPKTDKAP